MATATNEQINKLAKEQINKMYSILKKMVVSSGWGKWRTIGQRVQTLRR